MSKVMKWFGVLLCFYSSMVLSNSMVLTTLDNSETVAVNQRVTLSVTLLTDAYFTNGPLFRLPTIKQALVLQQDKGIISSFTDYKGSKYVSQMFTIDIYPTHMGVLTVPSINITSQVEGEDVKLSTQAFTLVVSQPPPIKNLGDILVSEKVEVKESWGGIKPDYNVGDILTRKIVVHAQGSSSLVFPDFAPIESAAYSIQIGSPQLQDVVSRNDNFSESQQTLIYTIKQSGLQKLGGETLNWWNPTSQQVESYQFNELKVSAGFSLKQFFVIHWVSIVVLLALFCTIFLCARRVISFVKQGVRYLFNDGVGWFSLLYRYKTCQSKNINLFEDICSNDRRREKVMRLAFRDNQRINSRERLAFFFTRSKLEKYK